MASQLVPFAQAQMPAHLATVFGDDENIVARSTINQLSYKGKTWRLVIDGEEKLLNRKDAETGDVVPVQIVNVVVLDHHRKRSRAYYEGSFEDGKNAAPTCASNDGVTPDEDFKEPQCSTCAVCPKAVKGSKVTDNGVAVTACAPNKRLAIVPSGVKSITNHVPLLLRMAQTSVWDKNNKENEAQGWYAWDQYLDMLRARGANNTANVETRIKCDPAKAYPKLLFSASRWLEHDEAEAAKAKMARDKDAIHTIIFGKGDDGVAGQPAPVEREPVASTTPDPAIAAAAAQQAQEERDTAAALKKNADALAAKEAAKLKKKADAAAALAQAQAAAAAAEADEDDSGFGGADTVSDVQSTPVPAKIIAAAQSGATSPVAPNVGIAEGTPAGLTELLADWDA